MGKEPVEYKPFKCPDCKVWWRTATHRCETEAPKLNFVDQEKRPRWDLGKNTTTNHPANWIYCDRCSKKISKYDWHTCYRGNEYDWHKYKDNPPKRDS